jgi:hypothetical protein
MSNENVWSEGLSYEMVVRGQVSIQNKRRSHSNRLLFRGPIQVGASTTRLVDYSSFQASYLAYERIVKRAHLNAKRRFFVFLDFLTASLVDRVITGRWSTDFRPVPDFGKVAGTLRSLITRCYCWLVPQAAFHVQHHPPSLMAAELTNSSFLKSLNIAQLNGAC